MAEETKFEEITPAETTTSAEVTETAEVVEPAETTEVTTPATTEVKTKKPKTKKAKVTQTKTQTEFDKMTKAQLIDEIHKRDTAFNKLKEHVKNLCMQNEMLITTNQKHDQANIKQTAMLHIAADQLMSIANTLKLLS